ncbi:MAG: serine/threonine protein kinase [Hamadaea sp.]|nr:serine/threonine protein kinase [Hamadaea sp.]
MSGVQALRPGEQLQIGGYRLLGRLGEGGMGTVYLADAPDGTKVAIKVIRDHLLDRAEFRNRFRGEVERAKTVPPFCTAEVIEADPDHDPPYFVAEYVDGPSLADIVKENGPLSGAALHSIGIGVATALTAIHGAGIIHRDLKPANVLLPRGGVKVIDFGLARDSEATSGITQTDQVMGTIPYLSPERLGGGLKAVTQAADIFAWGAVMCYAATGHTPFAADTPATTAIRILTEDPRLDGINGSVRAIVARTLAKNPKDRPTARELLDLLMSAGSTRTVPAGVMRPAQAAIDLTSADAGTTTEIPAFRVRPKRRRRRSLLVGLAMLLVLLGVATVVTASGFFRPWGAGAAGTSPTPGDVAASPVPFVPPPGFTLNFEDPLVKPNKWNVDKDHICLFRDDASGFEARTTRVAWRCSAAVEQGHSNVAIAVTVTLTEPGTCAGIWFRYRDSQNGGYAMAICEDQAYFIRHEKNTKNEWGTVVQLHLPYDKPYGLHTPSRFAVVADGQTMTFYRDGEVLNSGTEDDYAIGKIAIGILQIEESVEGTTFGALFRDASFWLKPPAQSGSPSATASVRG